MLGFYHLVFNGCMLHLMSIHQAVLLSASTPKRLPSNILPPSSRKTRSSRVSSLASLVSESTNTQFHMPLPRSFTDIHVRFMSFIGSSDAQSEAKACALLPDCTWLQGQPGKVTGKTAKGAPSCAPVPQQLIIAVLMTAGQRSAEHVHVM